MGIGQHQPVRTHDNPGARAAGAALGFGAGDRRRCRRRCRRRLCRATGTVDAVARAGGRLRARLWRGHGNLLRLRCARAVHTVATAGRRDGRRGCSDGRVFLLLPIDEIKRRLNVTIQETAFLKADRRRLPLLHRRRDRTHQMHVTILCRQDDGGPLATQEMRPCIEVAAVCLLHRRDREIVLAQRIGV